MADSTIWWVLAGAAIAVELVTGTFYLLMLSLGLSAAAVAAYLGATIPVQLVVAALVGGGAVVAWRSYKKKSPSALPANANQDVNMDVGQTVHVDVWSTEGTSDVKYRGANWQVSLIAGSITSPGLHQIVEVIGSRLIVKKI